MKFNQIYIEEHLKENLRVKEILSQAQSIHEIKYIPKVEDIWGRVKKPYLQKRETLNLFIGEKLGDLVKKAPDAYGTYGDPHYYFIHAYNCIYECTYCYLQGYFQTPDLVFFINHEKILEEMKSILISEDQGQKVWFHAGEYSDSLALSHITRELPLYFKFFENHPDALMELRTKSANIRELRKLKPLENIIISLSLAPQKQVKENDLKTPPLTTRLKAMQELQQLGFPIALHFDPIIYTDDLINEYEKMIVLVSQYLKIEQIKYVSMGVVRFTKDVYYQVQKNYPESPIHQSELIKSFDGKIRYNKPMRMWMLNNIKNLCLTKGFREEQIYLCMEEIEN